MADPKIKKLTLASGFDELQLVESFVGELQEWTGFGDDLFGNVLLALSEAVTNAIVHGNKEDKSKKVYIAAVLEKDSIKISVKDEGEGFDPDTLPDPLKEENLLKEGGRGVYLIEQYADEITYAENGTRIILKFSL